MADRFQELIVPAEINDILFKEFDDELDLTELSGGCSPIQPLTCEKAEKNAGICVGFTITAKGKKGMSSKEIG